MSEIRAVRVHITGVVQGVGFRPFVYALAMKFDVAGWVRNTSAGVDIEIDGEPEALDNFLRVLKEQAPPLARINSIAVENIPPNGFTGFRIIPSQTRAGEFQPISPDVSICDDCERELFDPKDRRYRYPFINCTNCGPRFTIIKDIPYDRPLTTMAPFEMCSECAQEYQNPLDRRFHAQPVACPDCGPKIWLEVSNRRLTEGEQSLQAARKMLKEGKIVAVKGLGGFHLACDATNQEAVRELRKRKLRVDKPFAVMMPDVRAVETHCELAPSALDTIESRERPVVILHRRAESMIAAEVAPQQHTLGVMLPYTPLHHLLLERKPNFPEVLVMTSGNLSEEPIAYENDEARVQLKDLADAFLMHDRGIRTRCDDSVVRVFDEEIYPLRRSRGYAPFPVPLASETVPLLAAGAELKNTFCLTRGRYAFLSHHIGDMENYETYRTFTDGVAHLESLFRIKPEVLVHDLHPDYLGTRYVFERAESEGLPAIGVQHHHAHIAACMAENQLSDQATVIGVAFDGIGYGEDGAIWGGEFLVAGYKRYRRVFHLSYVPLPGGDVATRKPWRLALAWLRQADLNPDQPLPGLEGIAPEAKRVVLQQLSSKINAPPTSSMGRLFDAVSALCGLRQEVNYEAQAAIELEACLHPTEQKAYTFELRGGEIDPVPLIRSVVRDIQQGVPVGNISARFHSGIAEMVLEVCQHIQAQFGLSDVVLSGGVWQNMVLLTKVVGLLKEANFKVYWHRLVPTNDGGLALGQAAVALSRLENDFS